ncbi:DUF5112 domain-containing protein [Prolixibacteraceae bacterium JC049]|nr:DUF5112 domain-containing protein [Prolixibacteraceae bacterium JC049]
MKLPFIIGLLLWLGYSAHAQKVSYTPEQKKEVDQLNAKSKGFWYESSDSTIIYAQKALKLARLYNYKKGEADAYNSLGVGHYFSNDYDKVQEFYQKSLDAYGDLGDKKGFSSVATLYYRLGKYEKALVNYRKSLEASMQLGDTLKTTVLLGNVGDVYQSLGNYDVALDYYHQMYILLKKKESSGNKSRSNDINLALTKIADTYFYSENFRQAAQYYQTLYDRNKLDGSKHGMALALNNLALSHFAMKHMERAEEAYAEALDLNKEIGDTYGLSVAMLNMAKLYQSKLMYAESMELIFDAMPIIKKMDDNDLRRKAYKLLVAAYEFKSDFKKALEYQKEYDRLSELIVNEEKTAQMANSLVISELGIKQQDNLNLQIQLENKQLRLERQSLLNWQLIFGSTLLFILIAVLIVVYSYYLKRKENRNLNEQIKLALQKQDEQQQIIVHQASLTSLGMLAAGIAHEINQPLQNISLSAEGIQLELTEEEPNMPFVRQSATDIFDDIQRAKVIVDHIRVFSYGQKEEVLEDFDPNTCVEDAMSMIARQYANHQINLKFVREEGKGVVLGNPHKLEQVIINLISNARDAVDEKERRKIPSYRKEIEISTYNENNQVVIEVSDNGVGIAKDKLTDIFLPFVTSKKKGKGTGLGLSISHSIIKNMKGEITVESQLDRGTSLKVFLPIYQYDQKHSTLIK